MKDEIGDLPEINTKEDALKEILFIANVARSLSRSGTPGERTRRENNIGTSRS